MPTTEVGEANAFPVVSNHLLDDSAYDVGSFVTSNSASDFAQAEGAAFISGNGTNKPKGSLAVTPEAADDATRTASAASMAGLNGSSKR